MNYVELSKEISYVLRHVPWEYEQEIDEEGWMPVEKLLDALRRLEKWKNISEINIKEMIEKSEKKRHQIENGRVRAFYGHTTQMKILKEIKRPPNVLYHGTARQYLHSIKENGLLPMSRQYVHLSQKIDIAHSVGMRHDSKPYILRIDARGA